MANEQVHARAVSWASQLIGRERVFARHVPQMQRHHLDSDLEFLSMTVAYPDQDTRGGVWPKNSIDDVLGHSLLSKCHGLVRMVVHPDKVVGIDVERDYRQVDSQGRAQERSTLWLERKTVCGRGYTSRLPRLVKTRLWASLEREVCDPCSLKRRQHPRPERAMFGVGVFFGEDHYSTNLHFLPQHSSRLVGLDFRACARWRRLSRALPERYLQLFRQRLQPSRPFKIRASLTYDIRVCETTDGLEEVRERVVAGRVTLVDDFAQQRQRSQVVTRRQRLGTPLRDRHQRVLLWVSPMNQVLMLAPAVPRRPLTLGRPARRSRPTLWLRI